ncbi:vesicular inhibitory amino acid transporter-like [Diretmus argenteus]
MGSLRWAWSSGQPWTSAGSLWGWAASRLQLDWTARFFQEDEEMLVLTQRDELNRTYSEDNRLPVNNITTERRPSCDDTREDSLVLIQREEDSLRFNNSRTYGKGRPRSTEYQADKSETYSEGKPNFNQSQTSKGRNYKLAGQGLAELGLASTSFLEPWHCRGSKESEEQKVERPSGLEEEGARLGLANGGIQSPIAGTAGSTPTPTITTWEAGWNVTNAIQGIFVLGLPYALVQSGYLGLVLLVLSAWVCNHTGRILVACLYEEEHSGASGSVSQVRVRQSYQDVAKACCGGLCPNWAGLGGWMVNVAQVVELLMTCTLYLVVSTSLLSDSLSGLAVPRSVCSLVSLMFLLPCLLLTDLRSVSTLSLLCSLAHILISLLVILYCLSRAGSWSWSSLSPSVDPEDFLISVGVIIFSYTSQIFLPPLEGSMEDRGQFSAMLGWTHAAACIMKTTFSLLAVLTWGVETSEVITDNLPSNLRPLVNLCLLAKALLSYPLPFYSAAEILQPCMPRGAALSSLSGGQGVSRLALLVRVTLLLSSYLLALLVPRFSLLMGLTGSVTGAALTLILPCLFHLTLQWRRLNLKDRVIDVGILSLGGICSVSGVICSLKRLVEGL